MIKNFWQKVNPIKLFLKQGTEFTITTFEGDNTSSEVPLITNTFLIEFPRKLSLKVPKVKPAFIAGNAGLCVRYRKGNIVTRYRLFTEDSWVLAPVYNGEVLEKNTVIEVWCKANAGCGMPQELTLPTSLKNVKQKLTDSDKVEIEGAETFVKWENEVQLTELGDPETLPVTQGLVAHFKSDPAFFTYHPEHELGEDFAECITSVKNIVDDSKNLIFDDAHDDEDFNNYAYFHSDAHGNWIRFSTPYVANLSGTGLTTNTTVIMRARNPSVGEGNDTILMMGFNYGVGIRTGTFNTPPNHCGIVKGSYLNNFSNVAVVATTNNVATPASQQLPFSVADSNNPEDLEKFKPSNLIYKASVSPSVDVVNSLQVDNVSSREIGTNAFPFANTGGVIPPYFCMGNRGNFVAIDMKEVLVYNRILSEAEIVEVLAFLNNTEHLLNIHSYEAPRGITGDDNNS